MSTVLKLCFAKINYDDDGAFEREKIKKVNFWEAFRYETNISYTLCSLQNL